MYQGGKKHKPNPVLQQKSCKNKIIVFAFQDKKERQLYCKMNAISAPFFAIMFYGPHLMECTY